MMREKNFSAAMERAVQTRGSDWKYPKPNGTSNDDFYQNGTPTYVTEGGEATCLIGAAMHEAGMEMPSHLCTSSALALLGDKVSTRVAMAARAAQVHQDCHKPWGEALKVYYAALEYCREREAKGIVLGPWDSHTVYYEAAHRVGVLHPAMSQAHVEAVTKSMQNLTAAMTNLSSSLGKITFEVDLPMPSAAMYTTTFPTVTKGGITITNAAPVKIEKKEHALVA